MQEMIKHVATKCQLASYRASRMLPILFSEVSKTLLSICDTIKGNESLVEKFNFYFLTPLSERQNASF